MSKWDFVLPINYKKVSQTVRWLSETGEVLINVRNYQDRRKAISCCCR